MIHSTLLPALAALIAVTSARAADAPSSDKDPISKYQADLSGGAVSASEILGVTQTAVTTLQTPKDFTAALGALTSDGGKAAFGVAFTPARTTFAPVSIAAYVSNSGARIWAGTTFSYAQNTRTEGSVDYRQQAFAVRVAWYVKAEDDPFVAGYSAFAKCDPLTKLEQQRGTIMVQLMERLAKERVPPEQREAKAQALMPAEMANKAFIARASVEYKECVDSGVADAKAKWNTSQVALALGEGRIRGAAAGSSDLSLGRNASLTLALGPNPDSLVNLTLRRTNNSLDVSTIAGTPAYKSNNLAGLRWTYRSVDTQDLYGLAEISNAKANNPATSSVFKYAIGIDKRLAEGRWLEFRLGRNRTQDGKEDQTTGMMTFKFSPSSTLFAH